MSIRGLCCITEILNGRRAITGDTALRLAVRGGSTFSELR